MARIIFINFLFTISFPLFAQQVTYYEHVAPIIVNNCLKCHRSGHVAPFPLETFKDVAAKAKLIKHVTSTRYMPPWIADPKYRHYEGERILTDQEIETIAKWVDQGKIAGDKSKMPDIPRYSQNSLIDRSPDLILTLPEAVYLPGDNKERFITVRIPYELPEGKDVMAIEFIPDNRLLVHHMNYSIYSKEHYECVYKGVNIIDRTGDLGNREEDYARLNILDENGEFPEMLYYSGWVPGMSPQVFGDEFGIKLPARGIFLFDAMHYSATPVDEFDQSKLYIYFKDKPVERQVTLITIGSGSQSEELITPPLFIPANEVKTFKLQVQMTVDMSILYLGAHMHLIGKKYIAYAVLPNGNQIPLLKIDNWDFNWQELYKLNPPLHIPVGSTIYIEATYDNTVNNPFNPFNPPRDIISTGNMETTNEMLNLIILAVEYQPGDELRMLRY